MYTKTTASISNAISPCFALATCQWLASVSPLVGICVVQVVVADEVLDALSQRFDGTEIPSVERAATENTEPDLDLVHPAPVLGREMHDMFVRWIHQEGAPLCPSTQHRSLVPDARHFAKVLTQFERPMGIQVVHDPVEALHVGKVLDDVAQVPHEVPTAALPGNRANHLTGRYHPAGQQTASTVADVFVITAFVATRPGRTGRPRPFQGQNACLFIDTHDQLALLVQARSIQVQPTDVQNLTLEFRIVAVQPVTAFVGTKLAIAQRAPNGTSTHVAVMGVAENVEGEIVQRPARRGQADIGRLRRRQTEKFMAVLRGKKRAVGRSVAGLAVRPSAGVGSADATWRPYRRRSRVHWQHDRCGAYPIRHSAGPVERERPRPGAWNASAPNVVTGSLRDR